MVAIEKTTSQGNPMGMEPENYTSQHPLSSLISYLPHWACRANRRKTPRTLDGHYGSVSPSKSEVTVALLLGAVCRQAQKGTPDNNKEGMDPYHKHHVILISGQKLLQDSFKQY